MSAALPSEDGGTTTEKAQCPEKKTNGRNDLVKQIDN